MAAKQTQKERERKSRASYDCNTLIQLRRILLKRLKDATSIKKPKLY